MLQIFTHIYAPVLGTVEFCFATDIFNLRHAPTQTGEIVMNICGIGIIFINRSYFWSNPSQFFVGGKQTRNFTMGPMGFWATVCKTVRPMLSVLSVLSATLVIVAKRLDGSRWYLARR